MKGEAQGLEHWSYKNERLGVGETMVLCLLDECSGRAMGVDEHVVLSVTILLNY